MIDAKRLAATDILARALASTPDPFSIGVAASIEETGEHGVSAEVTMPDGSRFRIVVEWIGDREGNEA